MNIPEVQRAIKRVIKNHRDAFLQIGSNQTELLELGAITGIAEHYRSCGYSLRVSNPNGQRTFMVKKSTRGFPWDFSHIVAERNSLTVELHMNLPVRSACGKGIYCVDVGIVVGNVVPVEKPPNRWECIENQYLITFAEAKKLGVYPMLLAQFLGMVHELKPSFLQTRRGVDSSHLSPILIALKHFSENCQLIVNEYTNRRVFVTIAENYDMRLARVRSGSAATPFDVQPAVPNAKLLQKPRRIIEL
jgi:hypothetical protein